ncbi:unnamed protein product [Symbiodinium sp. KB8]|nr:unnamed protein product [Symbiodinium sp. KB8]
MPLEVMEFLGQRCTTKCGWLARLGRSVRQCRMIVQSGATIEHSFARGHPAVIGGMRCIRSRRCPSHGVDDRIEYDQLRNLCTAIERPKINAEDLDRYQKTTEAQALHLREEFCRPKWVDGYCEPKSPPRVHARCTLQDGQFCKRGLVKTDSDADITSEWGDAFKEPPVQVGLMPWLLTSQLLSCSDRHRELRKQCSFSAVFRPIDRRSGPGYSGWSPRMKPFLALLALAAVLPEADGHLGFLDRSSKLTREVAEPAPPTPDSGPQALPPKPWFGAQEYVLFVIAPGSAFVALAFVVFLRHFEARQARSGEDGGDLEVVDREPEGLDEDVYGAGIAALVRDSYSMIDGKGDFILRCARLASSFLLMAFVVFLQIYLIKQMQALVASRAVTEIRNIYGRYEFVMYGADVTHNYLTGNGFPRGLDEKYFDAANFARLTGEEKDLACNIPFSQMQILVPILFIWTLTIVADLRRCGDLFVRLILATPTITSMKDAVVEGDGECEIIVGLTKEVKAMLLSTCMIPRWMIDVYLLWLGCRWLCATPNFGDLLLNSVALEFVVLLKDTLFIGVVPDRNKRATQNTLIQPWQKQERANYRVFLSAFVLVLVSFSWVFYYIYRFQAVLPDYKWDVHEVCKSYIQSITSGKSR